MFREAELSSLDMFHNVYNMSSTATPTRVGRGLVIPGIDTKQSFDRFSTVLSYGGLHTPPQSAHESRRPSLQYPTLHEVPYSATPSSFAYSQPTTPIHNMSQGNNSFMHGWQESTGGHANISPSMPGACSSNHLAEATLHAPFEPGVEGDTSTTVDNALSYPHPGSQHNEDAFGIQLGSALSTTEAWRTAHQMSNGYGGQADCLGSALFPMSNSLQGDTSSSVPAYEPLASSFQGISTQYGSSTRGPAHTYCPSAAYQQPQVVVPSQLSPHDDYGQHQYSDCAYTDQSHDSLSTSFDSSSTSFTGYDIVTPPSPVDAYFAHSEDEDYLMVKSEEFSSPSTGLYMHSMKSARGLPIRPKRRASKRLRHNGKSVAWYRDDTTGIEVRCEGRPFKYDGESIKFDMATSGKPHKCQFLKENGDQCNAKFERSEHLKRHMGMHSKVKPYPCPLEGCGKNIQRPDNAGDHFKTHLRPKSKGKRNDHVSWEILHEAIWHKYEDKKKAKKLLDGLRRWVENGMPETASNRRPS